MDTSAKKIGGGSEEELRERRAEAMIRANMTELGPLRSAEAILLAVLCHEKVRGNEDVVVVEVGQDVRVRAYTSETGRASEQYLQWMGPKGLWEEAVRRVGALRKQPADQAPEVLGLVIVG